MFSKKVPWLLAIAIFVFNINLNILLPGKYQAPLICVNEYVKYFSFGNESQLADSLWLRFIQEIDAYNQLTIAEPHMCPDKFSSWHFHIINVSMDLDKKFYELAAFAPLIISVTIGDSAGASILFDKSVENFPNDWKILYRASYQAQVEERNNRKAADLLYRAGKNGAPSWVMSLAGGLFNEVGQRQMAEKIYHELLLDAKDEESAKRLRMKLDNKLKNFFNSNAPSNQKTGN